MNELQNSLCLNQKEGGNNMAEYQVERKYKKSKKLESVALMQRLADTVLCEHGFQREQMIALCGKK